VGLPLPLPLPFSSSFYPQELFRVAGFPRSSCEFCVPHIRVDDAYRAAPAAFPLRLQADSVCILRAVRGHSDALAEAALLRDLITALTSDEAGMCNPVKRP
jgi:hypothetical protein